MPKTILRPKQILELINATLDNAEALIAESELLASHDRLARAFFLGIIALEESAKIQMLLRAPTFRTKQEWQSFWSRFKSHESKLRSTRLLDIANKLLGFEASEGIDLLKDRGDEPIPGFYFAWARSANDLKLASLYTDFVKGEVVRPEAPCEREDLEKLLAYTRQRLEMHRWILRDVDEETLREWGESGQASFQEFLRELSDIATKSRESSGEDLTT